MLITKSINQVTGVALGSTAIIKIPTGMTQHQALIRGTDDLDVTTDIGRIEVIANGKPIVTYKPGQILSEMAFDRRKDPATNNTLVVDFERYGLLRRDQRAITALGTGKNFNAENNPFPVSSLEIRVEIKPALAVGTLPGLSVKARQSDANVTGPVKKIRQFTASPSGAGQFDVSDLPKGETIHRVLFKSDKILSLKVRRDDYVVYERDKADNDAVQLDGVRTPQAGWFVFDPTEDGYGEEGLPTRYRDGSLVQDLRFELEMSGSEPGMQIVYETIGALGQ